MNGYFNLRFITKIKIVQEVEEWLSLDRIHVHDLPLTKMKGQNLGYIYLVPKIQVLF